MDFHIHELLVFNADITIRLISSVLLGFALGLERELTNKYAGLRTHILVCVGSCVFTVLSIYAFPMAIEASNPQGYGDPARIAAQIVTGIGFIGGGTVLRTGSTVSGLTTAATLWMAASIGMACGTGRFDVAMIATLVSVIVLVFIRHFETHVLINSTKNSKRLRLAVTCEEDNIEELYNYIILNFPKLLEINKKRTDKKTHLTKIIARVEVSNKKPIATLYKKFHKLDLTEAIAIEEDDD